MTEQELIDEFEEIWLNKTLKNKYDFSVSISQLATWNRKDGAFKCYVKGREKGYALAQETISQLQTKWDSDNERHAKKVVELEEIIKTKDAEIEKLKSACLDDFSLGKFWAEQCTQKNKAISEARELLSDLHFERLMDDCRCEHCRYLEKAKAWLESNK